MISFPVLVGARIGAALMLLLLIVAQGYSIWRAYKQTASSRSWPTTEGTIVESHPDASTGGEQRPDHSSIVRYRYRVGDREYEGDRIQLQTWLLSPRRPIAGYPVGRRVDIRYDPQDPGNAVLRAGTGLPVQIGVLFSLLTVEAALAAVVLTDGEILAMLAGLPWLALLVSGGLFAGGILAVLNHMRHRTARSDWPCVNGTIKTCTINVEHDTSGDERYCADISFAYRVAGHDYRMSSVIWGARTVSADRGGAAAIIAKYPVGSSVPVYYDPVQPTTAVLGPRVRGGIVAPAMLIVLVGTAAVACFNFLADLGRHGRGASVGEAAIERIKHVTGFIRRAL
jgi:hypothetical protein